jgi:hypothetical protein
LLQACDLLDTLSKEKDEVYEDLYQTEQIAPSVTGVPTEYCPSYTPEHRKYGFTIFAETDEFWSNTIGKPAKDITIQDIRDYIQ